MRVENLKSPHFDHVPNGQKHLLINVIQNPSISNTNPPTIYPSHVFIPHRGQAGRQLRARAYPCPTACSSAWQSDSCHPWSSWPRCHTRAPWRWCPWRRSAAGPWMTTYPSSPVHMTHEERKTTRENQWKHDGRWRGRQGHSGNYDVCVYVCWTLETHTMNEPGKRLKTHGPC